MTIEDEQQRRSKDAVDGHQYESSAAGTVAEEFQFTRRYVVDLDLVSKSLQCTSWLALQRASCAEDVHKVGQI